MANKKGKKVKKVKKVVAKKAAPKKEAPKTSSKKGSFKDSDQVEVLIKKRPITVTGEKAKAWIKKGVATFVKIVK